MERFRTVSNCFGPFSDDSILSSSNLKFQIAKAGAPPSSSARILKERIDEDPRLLFGSITVTCAVSFVGYFGWQWWVQHLKGPALLVDFDEEEFCE